MTPLMKENKEKQQLLRESNDKTQKDFPLSLAHTIGTLIPFRKGLRRGFFILSFFAP